MVAKCLPVVMSVRTTSSPSVDAKIRALLSNATAPPVKIGRMTFSGSKVVLYAIFDAMASVVMAVNHDAKSEEKDAHPAFYTHSRKEPSNFFSLPASVGSCPQQRRQQKWGRPAR